MKIFSALLFGVTLLSAATSTASAEDNVFFYGGSSIERWNQRSDTETQSRFEKNFGPTVFHHPVTLTGHSGQMIGPLTATSTVDVWNHKPRVVVFYGGENDLRAGNNTNQTDRKAEYVLAHFIDFVTNRNASGSEASAILFVSIKPSMDFFYKTGQPTATDEFEATAQRPIGPTTGPAATAAQATLSKNRRNEAVKANTLIHNWIKAEMHSNPQRNLYYISIWDAMLLTGRNTPSTTDDKPNPVYFQDFTHPTWQGYDQWAKVLRPRINRIWDLTAPVN